MLTLSQMLMNAFFVGVGYGGLRGDLPSYHRYGDNLRREG